MSDSFTNEDFLQALREAQESARPQGPGNFAEWCQEQRLNKSGVGAHFGPGFGLMGHAGNTNSRAPTGPNHRPSGNAAVGLKQMPQQFGVPSGADAQQGQSKYDHMRQNQPPPWIDDVNMANLWYSPMEPVWPFGPPYYDVPREWNFPVGYNLNYVPQRLNLVGQLRGMRSSWGVLGSIVETRKDQLLALPWTIQVRNKPSVTSKGVEEVRKFFRRPDGKKTYSQWARAYLDDLFVIDAPTLFHPRNLGGQVMYSQVLDGGTIFPLIDDTGRRPDTDYELTTSGIIYERRQPAFQQIIYGLPMLNMSEDEIIYGMMRPRPELPVFGFSPIEQIMVETTEAIRKTFYQLEFWRSGSIPELIITVPEAWTPRQIASFQAHFDAVLSGQLTLKSKVRFVPGGMKPFDIKNASGESLWSQRDELLVRLACYAFSVSPTPFVHQSNRATANQAAESANEEGQYPLMSYWKDDVMDTIIQEKLGYDDIEFAFLPRREPDQKKQSDIHQIRLDGGLMTRNEVRGELGLEPVEDGDYLTVKTGASVVRLDQIISGEALLPGAPAPTEPSKPAPDSGKPNRAVRGAITPRASSTSTPPVKKINAGDIAEAAARAKRNPTKKEKKLGNYRKGHLSLNGLKITIENEKGSKRGEKDRLGVKHEVTMPAAYGYINGTLGADGMQVDCYLGKHPKSPIVWIVDQDKFGPTGEDQGFDEHKVMLGYKTLKRVLKDYLKSHYDGLGHERASAVTQMSYAELKYWLKKGDMHRPVSEQGIGSIVARRGVGGGIEKADTVSTATNLLGYDQVSAAPRRKRKRKAKGGPRWLQLCVGKE